MSRRSSTPARPAAAPAAVTPIADAPATLSAEALEAIETDRRRSEAEAAALTTEIAERVDAEIEGLSETAPVEFEGFKASLDQRVPKGIRVKARRSTYRRGGRPWPDMDFAELAPGELSPEQSLAVLEDPVLIIQGEFEAGWAVLSPEIRNDLITVLRRHLAGEAEA